MNEQKTCEWAFYKGLFHLGCHFFLTSTICGERYTHNEIPYSGTCPECGGRIEQIERHFGRKGLRDESSNSEKR